MSQALNMLSGLLLFLGALFILIKLFIVLLFLMLLNPTACHALARATVHGIRSPWQGESEKQQ